MESEQRSLPWLNRGDRLVLLLLFGIIGALACVHLALRSGLGKRAPEIIEPAAIESHRIDINRAEWWELQALQGIGEKTAQAIVHFRLKHGAFKSVDDLQKVPGIGPVTLDRLRPHLTASDTEKKR